MKILGILLKLLGFRRSKFKEAIIAGKPEAHLLTAEDVNVTCRRRLLDGARRRLEKAQRALDAGDKSALPRLQKWQARVAEAERKLSEAKERASRHGD